MKLNLSNIQGENTVIMPLSNKDMQEYYDTYLKVCDTFGLEPEATIEELEKVHNKARILLSEYLNKFPDGKDGLPLVALPIDSSTHYLAQLNNGQVMIGIVANKVLSQLNIGGGRTNEREN